MNTTLSPSWAMVNFGGSAISSSQQRATGGPVLLPALHAARRAPAAAPAHASGKAADSTAVAAAVPAAVAAATTAAGADAPRPDRNRSSGMPTLPGAVLCVLSIDHAPESTGRAAGWSLRGEGRGRQQGSRGERGERGCSKESHESDPSSNRQGCWR